MDRLPDFLLIGAAKAGTTALAQMLSQHPDVFFSPNKEPSFFAWMGQRLEAQGPGDWEALSPYVVSDLGAYRRQFAGAGSAAAVGEASTAYLYHPLAAGRIAAHLPEARLIAILRQPAERAYAAYWHLARDGRETLDFAAALQAEPGRIAGGWEQLWHYRQMGYYAAQLQRYLAYFERSRLYICLYEDFQADAAATAQGIFRFLEVEDGFTPRVVLSTNKSGLPRLAALYRLLAGGRVKGMGRRWASPSLRRGARRVLDAWPMRKPPFDPDLRAALTGEYREDILRLQEMLQRDLSGWF